MKKWIIFQHAFDETKTILGVVSAFLTIICLIDFSEIFPQLWIRVLIVCIIFSGAFLAAVLEILFTRWVEVDLGEGRSAVVEYGDLFDTGEHIVIPVNDAFDTLADDTLIAKNSVHGQFIKRYYEDNTEELDTLIAGKLNGVTSLGTYDDDKKGNKTYYPLGTTINIRIGNQNFHLTAVTHFKGNNVHPDLEGYYMAILHLIEYLNSHTSKNDVYLPLIGSDRARLGKTKQFILENLLMILKMSRTPMPKIHIVLYKRDAKEFNLRKLLL